MIAEMKLNIDDYNQSEQVPDQ